MSFGVPPCTCTPGNRVNGHETWLVDKNCPEHGNPR